MNIELLIDKRWRVAIIWECLFKAKQDFGYTLEKFITGNDKFIEIPNIANSV